MTSYDEVIVLYDEEEQKVIIITVLYGMVMILPIFKQQTKRHSLLMHLMV